ncbi:type VI secretion system baseplate subunit TssK [Fluviispira vulneris]|uniref:type VI secretion system baseplate subunit TssK n=1 Tax=Fluviispira vulneris TaxID=2763012 RepID=UPI0016441476|nr:type VI secretion system baseplate subunit TssK [Fluviispira vulneris]
MNSSRFSDIPKRICIESCALSLKDIFIKNFENEEHIRKLQNIKREPNSYGVSMLKWSDSYLYSNILSLLSIECILVDGYEFSYQAKYKSKLSIDLNKLNLNYTEKNYVYLTVISLTNVFNNKKKEQNDNIPVYSLDFVSSGDFTYQFYTYADHAFLTVGQNIPSYGSSLPIALLKNENGKILLDDYVPPLLNIKNNDLIIDSSYKILSSLNKILFQLNEDISYVHKYNDILYCNEWQNKKNILLECISALENILNSPSTKPCDFYLECCKILAQLSAINPTIPLPLFKKYDHSNLLELHSDLYHIMENILEKEFPENFKLYKFNRKENYFYFTIPKKEKKNYKIALKKPSNGQIDGLLRWMRSALICESSELNSLKEKRALGFERKLDERFLGVKLSEYYITFEIEVTTDQNDLSEKTLIICQTSRNLHDFEPEEIILCLTQD